MKKSKNIHTVNKIVCVQQQLFIMNYDFDNICEQKSQD